MVDEPTEPSSSSSSSSSSFSSSSWSSASSACCNLTTCEFPKGLDRCKKSHPSVTVYRVDNPFEIDVEGTGACFEYRQFVKGYFKRGGKVETHELLNGQLMSTTQFNEDGPRGYGNRGNPHSKTDGYYSIDDDLTAQPDQANGDLYRGWDSPSMSGRSGESYEFNLHFLGRVIDKATGAIMCQHEWVIHCKGVFGQ